MFKKDENEIVWFEFNRPEVMNAINYDVMNQLEQMVNKVKEDSSIKAVVITSSKEGIFCSGGDLSVFHQIKTEEEAYKMLSRMASILVDLYYLPVPVVAYIDGPAVGGGCEIALACRYRIGTKRATFRFAQGGLGIITGWGGTTFMTLNKSINNGLTHFLTGKKLHISQLIDEKILDDVMEREEFKKWLKHLTGYSSNVIRSYLRAEQSLSNIEKVRQDVLKESRLCSILWEGEEHHRAVREFLNKKKN